MYTFFLHHLFNFFEENGENLIEASYKIDVVLGWHRPKWNLHDNVNYRSKVKFNYNTHSSCRDEKLGS